MMKKTQIILRLIKIFNTIQSGGGGGVSLCLSHY